LTAELSIRLRVRVLCANLPLLNRLSLLPGSCLLRCRSFTGSRLLLRCFIRSVRAENAA
jgi:hypothetical protein